MLTEIDKLRMYSNVLVVATTNLQHSIDVAFLDRADLKLKVELPSQKAIYQILKLSIQELIRCELIKSSILYFDDVECMIGSESLELFAIAKELVGLSGRKLSKQSFLAFSRIGKRECELKEFMRELKHFDDA